MTQVGVVSTSSNAIHADASEAVYFRSAIGKPVVQLLVVQVGLDKRRIRLDSIVSVRRRTCREILDLPSDDFAFLAVIDPPMLADTP